MILALGHRFLPEAPGVYFHNDDTYRRAFAYARFVPLCNDGIFWSASWEVWALVSEPGFLIFGFSDFQISRFPVPGNLF
jgi:hypothetical protein